jgi:rare lipoprotein A (peptidoglycan hydrolase)
MPYFRICAVILLLACLGACSHKGSSGGGGGGSASQRGMYKVGNPYQIDGVTYVPQEEFNHVETGVASWYGPGFHSKATANGETYDQQDHTAAHRTLQMPSIVRVTNLDNGRSTVVRINDRGPYARGRIIDMSRAAAEELAMTGKGTARVRIDQLPAESQAVKDVALGGGGPSEQQAALAQLSSGSRPAPIPVPAAAPPAQVEQAAAPPPAQEVYVRAEPQPPIVPFGKSSGALAAPPGASARRRSDHRAARLGLCLRIVAIGRQLLRADRGLLDHEQCRPPACPDHQLRLDGNFPGPGRRSRCLPRAGRALYDPRCRRHCRRPAEALWIW